MKGQIITLQGTPLDGLVQIEDRGPLRGRRDLVLQIVTETQGHRRWNAFNATGWTTCRGPDGLDWPEWRIPADRLDLATLADRARRPDRSRPPESTEGAAFKITEPRYGPKTAAIRTYADPAEFAFEVVDSVQWSRANQHRAAETGRRRVRGSVVIFDPVAAYAAEQLWNGERLWTVRHGPG